MPTKKAITYTPEQLYKRGLILQSQLLFGNFLNTDIITALVDLFKYNKNDNTSKIVKYIEDQREKDKLNSTNIKIESEVYGIITNSIHTQGKIINGATLFLKVIKNNKEFIHLTIHLVPTTINSDKDGLIHIYKDIYKIKGEKNKSKSVSRKDNNKLYALISVKQPDGKPNSLEFSINNDYYKTNVPTITNVNKIDEEINKEMDVIVIVLNRLFDQNDIIYIGNKAWEIHNNTDKVLTNVNTYSILTTRKNKGVKTIIGRKPNSSNFTMNRNIFNRLRKNKMTRKVRK